MRVALLHPGDGVDHTGVVEVTLVGAARLRGRERERERVEGGETRVRCERNEKEGRKEGPSSPKGSRREPRDVETLYDYVVDGTYPLARLVLHGLDLGGLAADLTGTREGSVNLSCERGR